MGGHLKSAQIIEGGPYLSFFLQTLWQKRKLYLNLELELIFSEKGKRSKKHNMVIEWL